MELEATLQWTDIVTRMAAAYAIEPAIILAIIYVESRGDPTALNQTSMATGLMQVMPQEAHAMFCLRPPSEVLLDPETNIAWGLKILSTYIEQEGTLWAAIYRYSGGKAWRSQAEFTHSFWLPFAEAWAEIEQQLRAQEQDGRLRIRHRNNSR